SSNFATERVTTIQTLLCRSVDRSPRRLPLCNQVSTLRTHSPETISPTVNALARLASSPIPWIHIIPVHIRLLRSLQQGITSVQTSHHRNLAADARRRCSQRIEQGGGGERRRSRGASPSGHAAVGPSALRRQPLRSDCLHRAGRGCAALGRALAGDRPPPRNRPTAGTPERPRRGASRQTEDAPQ